MQEYKQKELDLLTYRHTQKELLAEQQELIDALLEHSPAYRRLQQVEAQLKEINDKEKAAKADYAEVTLIAFQNSNLKDHTTFNKEFYEQYHVKITQNSQIMYDEDRIFDVLHWIRENGFWDEMVSIKTSNMVTKLKSFLPAYPKEGENTNLPLIWPDWFYGTRVDGDVWEFEAEEELDIEDKNG